MQRYLQQGTVVEYTEPGSGPIAAGALVQIGALVGVALGAIAQGGTGYVALQGVFRLPKAIDPVYPDKEEDPTPPDEDFAIAKGARLTLRSGEFYNEMPEGGPNGDANGAENGDILGPGFVAWADAGPLDDTLLVKLTGLPVAALTGIGA